MLFLFDQLLKSGLFWVAFTLFLNSFFVVPGKEHLIHIFYKMVPIFSVVYVHFNRFGQILVKN